MVEKINDEEIEVGPSSATGIEVNSIEDIDELNSGMAQALDEAKHIINDSQKNPNLSPATKEKVSFMSKIMAKLSGGNEEQKNAKALAEIMAHPSANMAYEQALEAGRGEEYVKAYRYFGLPLYWNNDKQEYSGQPWSAN